MYLKGVLKNVARRYKDTTSDYIREQMSKYMAEHHCPSCKGNRLKKESLAVLIQGRHISEVTSLSIEESLLFFKDLQLTEKEAAIAKINSTRNS